EPVARLGWDLFDRIKVFSGYIRDLGRSLQQAVERYNKGVGSLEARVLPAARRFENLGVVPCGSEIPLLEPIETNARVVQAWKPRRVFFVEFLKRRISYELP